MTATESRPAPPLVPESARPTVSRARYGLLACLFVVTALNYLDRTNLSVTLPHIKEEMHLTGTQQGLLLSSFSWAYLLLQIPAGRLIDRVGAKLSLGYAMVGWSLATVAIVLAKSFAPLLGMRIALGAMEAPAFPSNNRLVVDWFPGRERGRATATYTAGEYVGLAVAAPVLSLLTVQFGWRSVFLVTGLAGLVFSVVWFLRVHNRPEHSPKVSQAELEHIRQADDLETAEEAAEEAAPSSVRADLRALLTSKPLWGLYIGQFANASVLFFFLTWFPSYLVDEKGMTILKAGLWASVPYIAALVGTLFGGTWSDRMLNAGRSRSVARKAPVMIGFVLASVIVLANFTDSAPLVITFMSVAFFAQGLIQNGWALFADMVPRRLTGTGGGLFSFMANLGGAVTPVLVGVIVDATGTFVWALGYIALLVLAGLLAYVLLIDKVERLRI